MVYQSINMLQLFFTLFILQSSQCGYWEDYDACRQQRIIQSKAASIVKTYLEEKWTLTDDERTSLLLEELTSPQKDHDIKALYFSVFNSILFLNNDGSIGESLLDYVYNYFCHDPFYVINYIANHQEYSNIYKQELAMYCYMTDKNANTLKQEIDNGYLHKEYKEHNKWKDAFVSDIGALISSYRE